MLRYTYELYFDDGDGRRDFQALTCFQQDLIPEVERVLAERSARSVDVHRMGRYLFTIGAGRGS